MSQSNDLNTTYNFEEEINHLPNFFGMIGMRSILMMRSIVLMRSGRVVSSVRNLVNEWNLYR